MSDESQGWRGGSWSSNWYNNNWTSSSQNNDESYKKTRFDSNNNTVTSTSVLYKDEEVAITYTDTSTDRHRQPPKSGFLGTATGVSIVNEYFDDGLDQKKPTEENVRAYLRLQESLTHEQWRKWGELAASKNRYTNNDSYYSNLGHHHRSSKEPVLGVFAKSGLVVRVEEEEKKEDSTLSPGNLWLNQLNHYPLLSNPLPERIYT